MIHQLKQNYKLIFWDFVVTASIPFVSLYIRLEGKMDAASVAVLKEHLPYIVMLNLSIFYFWGLYRRLWRYATIWDLAAILAAVSCSAAMEALIGIYRDIRIPGSVYIIQWFLLTGAVSCSRLFFKIACFAPRSMRQEGTRVLIVGAGDAGAMLAREIQSRHDANNRKIVGYVDDDLNKCGSLMFGAKVIGQCKEIAEISAREQIDEIIIAIPSAERKTIQKIIKCCSLTSCKVRILPGIYELINEKASLRQLRDVSLEDLLCRDAVQLDIQNISSYIRHKCVLITGAGGSIGSELCRQISKLGAQKIILLGRGENSIYEIHQELKAKYPKVTYIPVIADIRDRDRLQAVLSRYCPEIIFHAAAHKHVPLMEAQADEAVRNNIFGTKNVAELAMQCGCERFIMISTDKAVNPTSVMGATKRVAELVLQQLNLKGGKTKYNIVRFGNVLGSRGSVVPLFEKQIARGGPVTVTDAEMTRYFMTIPEASQLVLQAGAMARGGEIFLLDMGEPVKILDMAKELIKLHGLVPGQDIKIVFTGLRPGEKLYEELLTAEEGAMSTKHEKIFSAKLPEFNQAKLQAGLQILEGTRDKQLILKTLKQIIPTYQSKAAEVNDPAAKVS